MNDHDLGALLLALLIGAPWMTGIAALFWLVAWGRQRRQRRADVAPAPEPPPLVTPQEIDEAAQAEMELEVDYEALKRVDVPADRPAPDAVLRRLGLGAGRRGWGPDRGR